MDFADFQPVQFRAAVFTPGLRQFSAAHVLSRLLDKLSQLSGDPVVLPIPKDAPPEIPRIILRGPGDALELQIALTRSDVYRNASPGSELETETAFGEAVSILEEVLNALDVRPGRLAALGSYAYKCQNPADLLAEHFCKAQWLSGPLADLGTFELHAHRRLLVLEGLAANSWVRCKTGQVSESGRSFPAVVLERDVNTLPEDAEERKFDPEELSAFMRRASQSLGKEIENFFPEEGQ